jgi:hypothetical protein
VSEWQPYAETEEFAGMMDYLTEEIGVERREAEVCLQDSDLWPLIDPGSLLPFEGEEAVAQWKDAAHTLHALAESSYQGGIFDNPALAQSFYGAAIRAEEIHRRARERVGDE